MGAVAGGTIGNARDRSIEHDQRYHTGYANDLHRGHHANTYPMHVHPGHHYPSQMPAYGDSPYMTPRLNYYAPHVFAPQSPSPYDSSYSYGETVIDPGMPSAAAAPPMSTEDVVALVRSGLSESMIVRQIQRRGFNRSLSVSEIIALHQQGVSENVIDAMQGIFSDPAYPSSSADHLPMAIDGADFDGMTDAYFPPSEGRSYRYPIESRNRDNASDGPNLIALATDHDAASKVEAG